MARSLGVDGEVHLEWGPHRFLAVGDGNILTFRSLTGLSSLLALARWYVLGAPKPIRLLFRTLRSKGIRFRLALG